MSDDVKADSFVRTTVLFGKTYDWWLVDGVLTLLPHVDIDVAAGADA